MEGVKDKDTKEALNEGESKCEAAPLDAAEELLTTKVLQTGMALVKELNGVGKAYIDDSRRQQAQTPACPCP